LEKGSIQGELSEEPTRKFLPCSNWQKNELEQSTSAQVFALKIQEINSVLPAAKLNSAPASEFLQPHQSWQAGAES
jgi:hypothetical protein